MDEYFDREIEFLEKLCKLQKADHEYWRGKLVAIRECRGQYDIFHAHMKDEGR